MPTTEVDLLTRSSSTEVNTIAVINQVLGSFNKPFKSRLIIPVLVIIKGREKKEVRWRFRGLNNVTIITQQIYGRIRTQNMFFVYDAL